MRLIRDSQVYSLHRYPFQQLICTLCLALNLLAITGQTQELRESTDPYFDAKKSAHQKNIDTASDLDELGAQLENNATYTSYIPASENQLTRQEPSTDGTSKSSNIPLTPLTNSGTPLGGVSQASFNSPAPSPGTSFEPSQLLAVVGTEPIFVADMMLEINQTIEGFMPTAPAEIKLQQQPLLIKRLLPKYIEQKLLLIDTIRQLPEEVDFEDIVDQAVKEFDNNAMEKMMEGFGVTSTAEFDAVLRAQGSSLRKLRRSWSIDQLVRYFLAEKVKIDTDISHANMLEYYHEHIDEYEFPAKCRWQQVMVKYSTAGSKDKAQQKIVEIGNQIVYGASMEAVAKNHSDGFKASSGGIHDWTSQGSLVSKKLDEAIFTLPVGVLSDVIETSKGLHIVRVVERNKAGATPFLDAQVGIREKLEGQKRMAMMKKHIKKLRAEIPVEIYELPQKK